MLRRRPSPALSPFVATLWHADAKEEAALPCAARERMLPTGTASLVFRLSERPIRIFEGDSDAVGREFGHAVFGGPRETFYVRDTSEPSHSIGVHFHPGGASALLGIPGAELAARHTALADLWGRDAERTRERLLDAGSAHARLALLERLLVERRPARAALDPAVAAALAEFDASGGLGAIADVRRRSGYSARGFIERFHRAVGLTPKVYCRIKRFGAAVASAARGRPESWARLAIDSGYFDQSHLIREFRAFAGIAPGAYLPIAPDRPHHVPIRLSSRIEDAPSISSNPNGRALRYSRLS